MTISPISLSSPLGPAAPFLAPFLASHKRRVVRRQGRTSVPRAVGGAQHKRPHPPDPRAARAAVGGAPSQGARSTDERRLKHLRHLFIPVSGPALPCLGRLGPYRGRRVASGRAAVAPEDERRAPAVPPPPPRHRHRLSRRMCHAQPVTQRQRQSPRQHEAPTAARLPQWRQSPPPARSRCLHPHCAAPPNCPASSYAGPPAACPPCPPCPPCLPCCQPRPTHIPRRAQARHKRRTRTTPPRPCNQKVYLRLFSSHTASSLPFPAAAQILTPLAPQIQTGHAPLSPVPALRGHSRPAVHCSGPHRSVRAAHGSGPQLRALPRVSQALPRVSQATPPKAPTDPQPKPSL